MFANKLFKYGYLSWLYWSLILMHHFLIVSSRFSLDILKKCLLGTTYTVMFCNSYNSSTTLTASRIQSLTLSVQLIIIPLETGNFWQCQHNQSEETYSLGTTCIVINVTHHCIILSMIQNVNENQEVEFIEKVKCHLDMFQEFLLVLLPVRCEPSIRCTESEAFMTES